MKINEDIVQCTLQHVEQLKVENPDRVDRVTNGTHTYPSALDNNNIISINNYQYSVIISAINYLNRQSNK